jgi:predicted nucleic acid-binding protein
LPTEVIYWDTSAILSALLQDIHTPEARTYLERPAVHLVSSLAGAEFHACLARLQRDGHLAATLAQATCLAFDQGPWRRITMEPSWELFPTLSSRYQLRGADLWHLAMASSLRPDLPEIVLLTFDNALSAAAIGEGMA